MINNTINPAPRHYFDVTSTDYFSFKKKSWPADANIARVTPLCLTEAELLFHGRQFLMNVNHAIEYYRVRGFGVVCPSFVRG